MPVQLTLGPWNVCPSSSHCSERGPEPGPCWPPQNLGPDETLCLSPQDVRAMRPNDFGLYGAYGNVLELTLSKSDDGPLETPTTIETATEFVDTIRWDPDEDRHQSLVIVSGQYWMPLDGQCGSHDGALTIADVTARHRQAIGFRLVRTAELPTLTPR